MAEQLIIPLNTAFLLLLVALSMAVGEWVFIPLACRKKPPRGWQCRLTDSLLFLVQLATAGAMVFRPDPDVGLASEVAGLAVLWSLLALWWWMGVRILSRREIDDPLRRFIFLGIVCPAVYCWPLLVVMANPLFLIFFMNILLVIPLAVQMAVFWICRAIVNWIAKPAVENRRGSFFTAPRLAPLRFAACGLLCALIITGATAPLWTGITFGPMFYTTHLRRFRAEMRFEADIPAIQAWMKTQDLDALMKLGATLPPKDLPHCVSSISDDVRVSLDGTLRLSRGSGFGHWGLEVAPAGTPMPPSHPREYHLPLADGAWVWHEIQ